MFLKKLRLKTQLVLSTILICTLILVISLSVIYIRMLDSFKINNQETTHREFMQAENIINTVKTEVNNISIQIYNNSDITNLLNDTGYLKDYEHVGLAVNVLKQLSLIKEVNNYIESIYLVGNNGEVIGLNTRNNFSYFLSKENSPLYTSKIYTNLMSLKANSDSKMSWYGDIKSSDVGLDLGPNSSSLMVAAKSLKSAFGKDSAILLISINENAINEIYKYLKRSDNQNLYILDQASQVISSSDKNKIGKSSVTPLSQLNTDYGNFVSHIHGNKYQIIYYKLKDSGWVLVNELPLNEYMKDIILLVKTLAWIYILALVLSILLSEVWMRKLTYPLLRLEKAMAEVELGGIGAVITGRFNAEFGRLINRFNQMSLSIAQLIQENNEEQEKKRFYEIEALRAQINPHFLFNTLNSIKWMAKPIKAVHIENALTYLGEILRPLYKNSGTRCTVSEEIAYVTNYIKIMNIRFGDKIKLTFDIHEDLINEPILRFILQPIVENSILHGFMNRNYVGEITIQVMREEYLLIHVMDDGCGIADDRLEIIQREIRVLDGKREGIDGIGVINVNQRIKLHYGDEYGLEISNLEERTGVKVTCRLPLRK